jgi:hypothetical protein
MDEDRFHTYLIVLLVILLFAGATGLAYCNHLASIVDQATLGRLEQNVQTKNYEESAAQLQGLRRDIDNYKLEYLKATDPAVKAAILSSLCHRAQGVRSDLLPDDVKPLLANCQ